MQFGEGKFIVVSVGIPFDPVRRWGHLVCGIFGFAIDVRIAAPPNSVRRHVIGSITDILTTRHRNKHGREYGVVEQRVCNQPAGIVSEARTIQSEWVAIAARNRTITLSMPLELLHIQ